MFGFIKKALFGELTLLSSVIPLSAAPLNATQLGATPKKYVSMTNQECKVRPELVNVNSHEPVFYPFGIKASQCSGSCNNINDPYTRMCVLKVVKNLNVKVLNLMSRTNKTRHTEWHKTCKCKWRLHVSSCNNKHRWNDDKCRCECKELIDTSVRDKGSVRNHSNCEC